MRNKFLVARVIAFLLAFISIFTALGISGLGATEDFSPPGAQNKITLNELDIVEMVIGEELSEIEKRQIEMYGDFSVSYSTSVSASGLSSEYSIEEHTLRITALEYVYTAINSAVVTWIPVSAEVYGETLEFEKQDDGKYVVVFDGVESGEENTAKVKYTSSITISKEDINSLINIGYERTLYWRKIIEQKNEEYKAALEKYEADVSLYEEYLAARAEYEAALAVYKKYLSDYRIYQEKLEEYNLYIAAEAKYAEDLQKYNDYLDKKAQYEADYLLYLEYLAALDAYPGKLSEYNAYLTKLEFIRTQLAVIEANKTPVTDLARTIHAAIMGGTVTDVLDNKDAIANNAVGADPTVIDRAGVATENLRVLFTEYFAKKTEAEKYTYYVQNYEGFRDNFAELLRTLDDLYKNPKIHAAIKTEGKKEKFVILIAQLHYMTLALSDSPVKNNKGDDVFDADYVYGNRDYKFCAGDVSGVSGFVTKANTSAPIDGGYPAEMLEPAFPTEVAEPQKPTEVKAPTPPTKVEEPIAPEVVEEPTEPQKVQKPGAKPTPYVPSREASSLLALDLKKREELTEDYVIPLESTVTKTFIGAKEATVVYHGLGGEEIYTVTVEVGTYADFKGELPAKPEDEIATYVFSGWVDSEGNTVDLSKIADDIHVYPTFKTVYKYVDINWSVNGVIYTQSVLVGAMPQYMDTPKKPESDSMYYVFLGWDKEITPAKESVTYTAVFEGIYKSFNVKWVVDGVQTSETLVYGSLPEYDGALEKPSDSKMYYTFVGWDSEITPVTRDVTYTALFEGRYILETDLGGADILVSDGNYYVDCKDASQDRFNVEKLLELAAESGGVTLETKNATLTLTYSETLAAKALFVTELEVVITENENGVYSYGVLLYGADGELISSSVKTKLRASCNVSDVSHLILYYIEENSSENRSVGGERRPVPFVLEDGIITFDAYSGVTYYTVLEYSLSTRKYPQNLQTVLPVSLLLDKNLASPGDIISLEVDVPMGVILKSVYYIDSAGNKVIIENGGFVMPSEEITVEADFEYEKYTVVFMSDGKNISSRDYYYGETIVLPDPPKKANTTEYSYTFEGWSLDIPESVTESAVYEAVFSAKEMPKEVDTGLKITTPVLKIIVTGGSLLAVFLLMFLPALIIGIVFIILHKKRFLKVRKNKSK